MFDVTRCILITIGRFDRTRMRTRMWTLHNLSCGECVVSSHDCPRIQIVVYVLDEIDLVIGRRASRDFMSLFGRDRCMLLIYDGVTQLSTCPPSTWGDLKVQVGSQHS